MPTVLGATALFASAFSASVALKRFDAAAHPYDLPRAQAKAWKLPDNLQSTEEMCMVLDVRAGQQNKRTLQRKQAYSMMVKQGTAPGLANGTRKAVRVPPTAHPIAHNDIAQRTRSFLPTSCQLDEAQYRQAKCPPGNYMSDADRERRELRLLQALCAAKRHDWDASVGNNLNLTDLANNHYKTRGYMTFESSLWPKPKFCQTYPNRPWRRSHKELAVYRPDFSPINFKKMECSKYSVHFLKSWKVASMTFPSYLNCEYPGCNWEEVSVTKALQSDYAAVTAVRAPLARWVSAAGELLERAVNAYCPSGPCTALDGYVSGKSAGSTAEKLKHQTSWYAHLRETRADYSDADMANLVRAMVSDTVCNLYSYASEHLSTQSNFVTQNKGPAANLSYVMKLEDGDRGLARLSQYINGRNLSGDCTLVPANVKDCKPNGYRVPSEDDLYKVLKNEHKLMKKLCLVYAQDFVCFNYELPDVCKGMF